MTRYRPAYTLVEVLVCIGIVGVLIGLLMPAVQRARGSALRAKCLNQLRQTGVALHAFHAQHGRLPPRPVAPNNLGTPDNMLTWMALILPQMGHDALYAEAEEACRTKAFPFFNPPHTALAKVVPDYVCPADGRALVPLTDVAGRTAGYTSYIGSNGSILVPVQMPGGGWGVRHGQGVFSPTPGVRLTEITDGTSTTVMVGERPHPDNLYVGRWYTSTWTAPPTVAPYPTGAMLASNNVQLADAECNTAGDSYGLGIPSNPCDRYHFYSLHGGGANWLFADGSVRFLGYGIGQQIIEAIATYNAGEAVTLPD